MSYLCGCCGTEKLDLNSNLEACEFLGTIKVHGQWVEDKETGERKFISYDTHKTIKSVSIHNKKYKILCNKQ